MHNYITKLYITTVSLCNLHSYMFRHFRIIIRQFTTIFLLSYFLKIVTIENTVYKVISLPAYVSSQTVAVGITRILYNY